MWISGSPRQELRHLALRSVRLATKIGPPVSPLDPRQWHRYSLGSFFLFHQSRAPITSEGTSAAQKHREVCADIFTLLALAYRALVAKGTRDGALPEGLEGNTEKFGPLKVVLESIPPLYANHGVCLKLSAQTSP